MSELDIMAIEGKDPVREFARDLIRHYNEGDHSDVDGCDIQDMLLKHGLAETRKMTKAEAEETWAQEWGYEEGDEAVMYTDLLKELIK